MMLRFSCPADLHDRGCDILAVCVTRDQLAKLVDVLESHQDRGPWGEGWQSDELTELAQSVRQQAANLADCPE